MSIREGFPSKYLLEVEFHKLNLNFGDPFAKIFIGVSTPHEKKRISKYPVAKKETIINEIIPLNIILFEKSMNKYNDMMINIEVLLLKKDNQRRFVGDIEFNLADLAPKASKSTFEETQTIILSNSSHYNGKLTLTIKLFYQSKKQMRSLSQSNKFVQEQEITEELFFEENRKESTKKAASPQKHYIEMNRESLNLESDTHSQENFPHSEIKKKTAREERISLLETHSDHFHQEVSEEIIARITSQKEIQTDENFENVLENEKKAEELQQKIMDLEEILLKKEKELEIMENDRDSNKKNVKLLEEKISIFEKSIQSELEAKEVRISEFNEEKNKIIRQLENEKIDLHQINDKLSSDLKKNREKEIEVSQKIKNAEILIEEYKENIAELQKKINDDKMQKIMDEKELENLKKELKNMQDYNENLKKQITNKEKKLAELEENNTKIQEDFIKNKQKMADILNIVFEKGGPDLMEEIETSMGLTDSNLN